jgi:hypothetical protein
VINYLLRKNTLLPLLATSENFKKKRKRVRILFLPQSFKNFHTHTHDSTQLCNRKEKISNYSATMPMMMMSAAPDMKGGDN